LKRVLVAREIVATVETSLGEILRHFQPPCYHLIWIIDVEGEIIGFIGEIELIGALFEHGLAHKVGAVELHRI
jgi:CBS-domain-containing membrane protein